MVSQRPSNVATSFGGPRGGDSFELPGGLWFFGGKRNRNSQKTYPKQRVLVLFCWGKLPQTQLPQLHFGTQPDPRVPPVHCQPPRAGLVFGPPPRLGSCEALRRSMAGGRRDLLSGDAPLAWIGRDERRCIARRSNGAKVGRDERSSWLITTPRGSMGLP